VLLRLIWVSISRNVETTNEYNTRLHYPISFPHQSRSSGGDRYLGASFQYRNIATNEWNLGE